MTDKLATTAAQHARDLASDTKASATLRAYKADLEIFYQWCKKSDLPGLPASSATVAEYIAHLDQLGRKPATIRRALTAIRQAHKTAGQESPCDQYVQSVETGIRRSRGVAPRKAAPLTLDKLTRVVFGIPGDFIGTRDRAIFLLGWTAALRRSELVALNVEDIKEAAEGIVCHLRRSKTDQEGSGRAIPVPFIDNRILCAVFALRHWLEIAQIKSGPVFRSIGPGGRKLIYAASDRRLSPRMVSIIVKRRVKDAGFDPDSYSAHSLRSGFITSAAHAGATNRDIAKISGHHSQAVLEGYIHEGTLFQGNPIYKMLDVEPVTDWRENSKILLP